MSDQRLRGKNRGNPFAGIKRGADGYVGNVIFAVACIGFATLPWLADDPSFLKIMPYVSAVCGLGALYLLVQVALRIRRRVAWVEVEPDGLRWSCRGETFEERWEDVKSVHRKERLENGVAIGAVKVEFRDNAELEFNRMLSNYDAVAAGIQGLASAALRPAKERELATGKAEFGPVTLLRTGLDYKGREHNWADVDYGVVRGHLAFVPAGAEMTPETITTAIPLESIPDYAVLLELMEVHGKSPLT